MMWQQAISDEQLLEQRKESAQKWHGPEIKLSESAPIDPDSFDPQSPTICLFGCCSWEDTWEPGIKGWGSTDEESRQGGYVPVYEYDKLLAVYLKLRKAK